MFISVAKRKEKKRKETLVPQGLSVIPWGTRVSYRPFCKTATPVFTTRATKWNSKLVLLQSTIELINLIPSAHILVKADFVVFTKLRQVALLMVV